MEGCTTRLAIRLGPEHVSHPADTNGRNTIVGRQTISIALCVGVDSRSTFAFLFMSMESTPTTPSSASPKRKFSGCCSQDCSSETGHAHDEQKSTPEAVQEPPRKKARTDAGMVVVEFPLMDPSRFTAVPLFGPPVSPASSQAPKTPVAEDEPSVAQARTCPERGRGGTGNDPKAEPGTKAPRKKRAQSTTCQARVKVPVDGKPGKFRYAPCGEPNEHDGRSHKCYGLCETHLDEIKIYCQANCDGDSDDPACPGCANYCDGCGKFLCHSCKEANRCSHQGCDAVSCGACDAICDHSAHKNTTPKPDET